MTKIFFLINVLIISLLPTIGMAQTGGNATYNVLELNVSPVSTALGGKTVSNALSSDLIFYNPALLTSLDSNTLSLSYQAYLAGINIGEFSYAFGNEKWGNIATGVHYVNYGKFDQYDQYGNYYGQFTANDYVPYITYSFHPDSQLTIGVNLKAIYSSLEAYTSYGYSIDLGMFFHANDYLSLGIVARNLGKQLKPYYTTYEPLPFNLSAGITGKLRYAPIRMSFTLEYLNQWNLRYVSPLNRLYLPAFADTVSTVYHATVMLDEFLRHASIGMELLLSRTVRLMIGYNYRRAKELTIPTRRTASGLSLGLLIDARRFSLSYSMQKISLMTVHSFGISLKMSMIFYHTRK